MVDRATGRTGTRGGTIVGLTLFASIMMLFGFTNAGAQGADDPAQLEAGMAVFEQNCARCHGENGEGSATGRPLIDIATQQPDRSVHIASVTGGKGGMPSFSSVLSDEEIDAAVSYVRLSFVSDAADDAAVEDTAAEDAPAEDAAAEEELAETGVESQLFAIAGVALLAAGGLMVGYTREASKN